MARRGFLAAQYHSIVGWLLNFIPGQWLTRGFEVFFVPGNDINKIVMDLNIYCFSLSKQRPADGHLIAFNVRRRAAFFSAAACTSHTFGIPSEPCASKYGLWYIYIFYGRGNVNLSHTHTHKLKKIQATKIYSIRWLRAANTDDPTRIWRATARVLTAHSQHHRMFPPTKIHR